MPSIIIMSENIQEMLTSVENPATGARTVAHFRAMRGDWGGRVAQVVVIGKRRGCYGQGWQVEHQETT